MKTTSTKTSVPIYEHLHRASVSSSPNLFLVLGGNRILILSILGLLDRHMPVYVRSGFYIRAIDILSTLLSFWFTHIMDTTSTTAATKITEVTAATKITEVTATTISVTAVTDTQAPIQAPIQTVPVRYRPIHITSSDHLRQIPTEFVNSCYLSLACYSSLVLSCYFRYFDKWMDHLLILTTLLCAGWLNCLVLFLTIQTWPLKLKLKTLEKWKDQLLILARLPCATVLSCLVLFRTSQTWPFNLAWSICLWYLNMVVVVELSDLWRAQRKDGDSFNSISVVMIVILIVSRRFHVNLMIQINE